MNYYFYRYDYKLYKIIIIGTYVKRVISLIYFRWLYIQHRKEIRESYEQLPEEDILKNPHGAVTSYGAIE